MNFENRIKQLEQQATKIAEQIAEVGASYQRAEYLTADLLSQCADAGITGVAINSRHESVPVSMTFPFGVQNCVFTAERGDKDTWPAIWGICDRLGISAGCGNPNQRQITSGAELVDGVYALKSGQWIRVE